MDINVLSGSGFNRFAPKNLNSAFQDITHSSFLLTGFGTLINNHPLIAVNSSSPRLTQSARDCQKALKKQSGFYGQQMKPQLMHLLVNGQQAASEQIAFSESLQNVGIDQSDLTIRQSASNSVNRISEIFNQYYVRARELAEISATISVAVKSESGQLSRHLDQYARHLPKGRENALAIMTGIDLLDDTLGQSFDDWVINRLIAGSDISDFVIATDAVDENRSYQCLQLQTPDRANNEELNLSAKRHSEQRNQLYHELSKVSRILVAVKTIEAEVRQYSNYMGRLHAATKKLSVNWGKVSNDFAIQAYQLGAQSDSNQLFQIIASDIPVATNHWRLLSEDVERFRQGFSESKGLFSVDSD